MTVREQFRFLLPLILLAVCSAQDKPKAVIDLRPKSHNLFQEFGKSCNATIALTERLTAHYRSMLTWDNIDPNHPDAVALRSQIPGEEAALAVKTKETRALLDKLQVLVDKGDYTQEDPNESGRDMKELSPATREMLRQKARYDAVEGNN